MMCTFLHDLARKPLKQSKACTNRIKYFPCTKIGWVRAKNPPAM